MLLRKASDSPDWITKGPLSCGLSPTFSYICYICHDTREVDEIIDFYHHESQTMLEQASDMTLETLSDSFFEKCYFKIRNKGAS
jgi:hypothetical protein